MKQVMNGSPIISPIRILPICGCMKALPLIVKICISIIISAKKRAEEYVKWVAPQHIPTIGPVIGQYGVNKEGSGDMYYKGCNLLHTIRQVINDDEKWRQILRGLNKDFYHQTVTTQQIENYISEKSGIDLSKVFDQYLRTTMVPIFEYQIEDGNALKYRYTNVVDGFDMPLRVYIDGEAQWLYPTTTWKTENADPNASTFKVDRNFYVEKKEIK